MKSSLRIIAVCMCVPLSQSVFAAKDPKEAAIEARQGEMEIRAFYSGRLFAMAKGDAPYNAERAKLYVGNLKALLAVDMSDTWVPGSDSNSYRRSEAKPGIWQQGSDIGKYARDYKDAVNALADNADKGLDALKANARALGKSCKGCHDEYKED